MDPRTAIVEAIQALDALPKVRQIEAVSGVVNAQVLQQSTQRTPALLVGLLQRKIIDNKTRPWFDLQDKLVIYALCADAKQDNRDDQAIALVDYLIAALLLKRCGVDRPSIEAQNLFSAPIERSNIALWALTWRESNDARVFADVEALGKLVHTSLPEPEFTYTLIDNETETGS